MGNFSLVTHEQLDKTLDRAEQNITITCAPSELQAKIDLLPKNLGQYTVTIYVTEGVYSGTITISRFTGLDNFVIQSKVSTAIGSKKNVTIGNLIIHRCNLSKIEISGINFETGTYLPTQGAVSMTSLSMSKFHIKNCNFFQDSTSVVGNKMGIYVNDEVSNIVYVENCFFYNLGIGVHAGLNSKIVLSEARFEKCNIVARAIRGGMVLCNRINSIIATNCNRIFDGDYTGTFVDQPFIVSKNSIIQITHSKTETVHKLTTDLSTASNLINVRFKATAPFVAGDTFALGVVTYTPKLQNGGTLENNFFVNGAIVECVLDTASKTINFKSGGGKGYGTLPSQSGITLQNVSNGVQITITRPNAENYAGTLVVRKVGSYPNSTSDGVQIDVGAATAYTDTAVADNTTYFYRAFAYNADKEYQTLVQGAQANIWYLDGIPISTLPVGALVKTLVKSEHQSLLGEYLVFRIADKNHEGYPTSAITLITDRIISMRCFDAKEPSNSDGYRRSYGNNRYTVSNIDQWLNSNATAGAWYSAQHSADSPPNVSGVSSNAYDTQTGFLAMINDNFVSALMQTTVIVAKNRVTDGGSYETKASKMFLASTTEVGLANENGIAEGSKLALFSNDTSRLAYCTQQAITNSNDGSKPANTSAAWYWWLRTPSSGSSYYVRGVSTSGALNSYSAYNGNVGVRPLCNLNSEILVSSIPDSDGAYIIKF